MCVSAWVRMPMHSSTSQRLVSLRGCRSQRFQILGRGAPTRSHHLVRIGEKGLGSHMANLLGSPKVKPDGHWFTGSAPLERALGAWGQRW